MVQTWATGRAGDEVCEHCQAAYEVTETRFPAKERFQYDCEVCGHTMRSENTTSMYRYKLVRRGNNTTMEGS